MRLFLFALLMAPAAAFAQMSPTPPETRPNPVFSMPIETMEPSPLPSLGETLPSLLGSSIPGAPPMMIVQPPQQPAPAPTGEPEPPPTAPIDWAQWHHNHDVWLLLATVS